MSEFFAEVFRHPATAFITFLLGLLIGNWLATGRDKRGEFRALSARPFTELNDQASSLPQMAGTLVDVPVDLLRFYVVPWRRGAFLRAYGRYCTAVKECSAHHSDWSGQNKAPPKSLDELNAALRDLRNWLTPR